MLQEDRGFHGDCIDFRPVGPEGGVRGPGGGSSLKDLITTEVMGGGAVVSKSSDPWFLWDGVDGGGFAAGCSSLTWSGSS